jgi:hypothetical protein
VSLRIPSSSWSLDHNPHRTIYYLGHPLGRFVSLKHRQLPLDFSSVGRASSRCASGHCVSQRDYSSFGLHWLYCAYAVHPDASSRRSTSRQSAALALVVCPVILLCVVTTRLTAATDVLRLCRASGCLGTSRDSSSTTSPTPRVQVPQHVAWLVVDYFSCAARPGASAARATRRAARCRLHRLRHTSGCLGTSRGSSRSSSRRSSSTTSPSLRVRVPRRLVTWLVVDYFAYATRPGASARRASRHVARRRLLRLCRASGCLGTSRGSSHGSSSTTLCTTTSSCGHTSSTSATPCVATTCLTATPALL